jgi:hypothetical protein
MPQSGCATRRVGWTGSSFAFKLWKFMDATLVIWGEITQQHNMPLKIQQHFLGNELDIRYDAQIETSGHWLAYYALSCAGFRLGEGGRREQAIRMFRLAKSGPAKELDPFLKGNNDPNNKTPLAAHADRSILKYGGEPELLGNQPAQAA